jgi:hypothetical protein
MYLLSVGSLNIATPESERLAQMIDTARQRACLSWGQMASYMGYSQEQLCRELKGIGNVAAWRLLRLPVDWWIEFLAELGGYLHLPLIVIRDAAWFGRWCSAKLAELVQALTKEVQPGDPVRSGVFPASGDSGLGLETGEQHATPATVDRRLPDRGDIDVGLKRKPVSVCSAGVGGDTRRVANS